MTMRRWTLTAVALSLYAAFMTWMWALLFGTLASHDDWRKYVRTMFSPAEWELDEAAAWVVFGAPVGVMLISQIVFLLPVVRQRPLAGGRAKSLQASMVAAAMVATLLTFGLTMGVIGLLQLLLANRRGIHDPSDAEIGNAAIGWCLAGLIVVSWVFWSIVLMWFAKRRQGRGVLSRVIGVILGGTILEVIVVLPVDIMIRRRTDCYCATGSFVTLSLSAWALLWLAGPGAVIAVTSRRRRLWRETHCEMCGYQKGPRPAEKCPECGYEWHLPAPTRANGRTA
jgi:hypothetical protein